MKPKESDSAPPFWVDDHAANVKSVKRMSKAVIGLSKIYGILIMMSLFILVIYGIFNYRSSPITWFCGAYLILAFVPSYLSKRYMKSNQSKIEEIQRQALEAIGASLIGSAVHVAGHPLLDRDEEVVMALIEDRLEIYPYTDSTPLTSISLADIEAVKTVTYDKDRIPHTEVIDSTAQALQLEFRWQDKDCTCLFRRMRKIRPIGWYDAIQKIRLK